MRTTDKFALVGLSTFLILFLRATFRYLSVWQYKRRHKCGSAKVVPDKFPYLGLGFQEAYGQGWRDGKFVAWTSKLLDNPGKTNQASVWGTTWLFTAHPENIRQIHSQAGLGSIMVVGPTRRRNNEWLGDGSFTTDGPRWKLSRSLFRPIFSRLSTAKLDRFQIHVDRFLNLIPDDGVSFDMQPMLRRLFLDTSFELVLGVPANSQLDVKSAGVDVLEFERCFQRAKIGTAKATISAGMFQLNWKTKREWLKDCHYVHAVFDEHIDRRLRNDQSHKQLMVNTSVLDNILEHSRDPKFIRDEMLSVYLGAKDTAALGMSDILFLLARSPRVWNKLRSEILQIEEATPLTFELLRSLKYLQCVLFECLRLYSPVTTMIRTPTEDCVLPRGGGESGQEPIFVPKGTRIEVHLPALHWDKDIWGSNAHEFCPERWENGRPVASWEYIPFSGAERICPAQQMLPIQFACLLVMFMRKFKCLENRDSVEAFEYEVTGSISSKNGVQVAVYRDDASASK